MAKILGVGTSEVGQGFKLPHIGLDICLRAPKATIKCILGYGSGSAAVRVRQNPQAKGNHHEGNNSIDFQCRKHTETSAGKSSPSQAAPSIPHPVPPASIYICIRLRRLGLHIFKEEEGASNQK